MGQNPVINLSESIPSPQGLSLPGVISGFSNRHQGNMSLVYGDTSNSLANRIKLLKDLGIDYNSLVCAKQIHADKIYVAHLKDAGSGALLYDDAIADTDAFITEQARLPLAIFTADCLSVFLYDSKRPAVGLVHSGWRGSREDILLKTIRLMHKMFGTAPENLKVIFGPGIRSCCYEVDREFCEIFPEALIKREGKFYLDLAEFNLKRTLIAGVKKENISDSCICTSCQDHDYFSYRREGKNCGRAISVIMLK